jgi:hypothetical protein
MSQPNNGNGYSGSQSLESGASLFNAHSFLVTSILAKISTSKLVRVMGVTNDGGVSPVGFVDILPLVNQIDGAGNAMRHDVIYKCPYLRVQGGTNAVILDPVVGDIGIAVFSDRDISSVIANKGQANPGSQRRFDMSDALYVGGVLNGTPTQYVQFSSAGIKLHSPVAIILDAQDIQLSGATVEITATTSTTVTTPTFTINGSTVFNGDMSQPAVGAGPAPVAHLAGTLTVDVDVVASGKSVHGHTHLVTAVGTQTPPPT